MVLTGPAVRGLIFVSCCSSKFESDESNATGRWKPREPAERSCTARSPRYRSYVRLLVAWALLGLVACDAGKVTSSALPPEPPSPAPLAQRAVSNAVLAPTVIIQACPRSIARSLFRYRRAIRGQRISSHPHRWPARRDRLVPSGSCQRCQALAGHGIRARRRRRWLRRIPRREHEDGRLETCRRAGCAACEQLRVVHELPLRR